MSVGLSRVLPYGISYSKTLVKCRKVVGSTYTRPETLTTAGNISDDYMVNSEQQPCSKLTWLVIQEDFICSRKFVLALQLIKHNYINKACSCTSHVIHMRLRSISRSSFRISLVPQKVQFYINSFSDVCDLPNASH